LSLFNSLSVLHPVFRSVRATIMSHQPKEKQLEKEKEQDLPQAGQQPTPQTTHAPSMSSSSASTSFSAPSSSSAGHLHGGKKEFKGKGKGKGKGETASSLSLGSESMASSDSGELWERKGYTALHGHRLSTKVESALVKQAGHEFFASNTYLAASLWFDERDLKGFAGQMLHESKEELKHGYGMLEYIVKRRAHYQVTEVPAPHMEFDTPDKVIEALYEMEVQTAGAINDLMALARSEGDMATEIFLHAYVQEQIDACDSMHAMHGKVKQHLMTGGLLQSMDKDLLHHGDWSIRGGCAKCKS